MSDLRRRLPWEPMRLKYEGNTGELIQLGVGKTPGGADPGEPFLKPPGQG